jgi:uncharacterized membrane protein
MPTKVSERKLLASIMLFASGCTLLLKAKLFAQPVYVSEKGLAFISVAIALIILAIILYRRALVKV